MDNRKSKGRLNNQRILLTMAAFITNGSYLNSWTSSPDLIAETSGWNYTISDGMASISGIQSNVTIGIEEFSQRVQRVDPWGETGLDYRIGADRYSYAEDKIEGKRVIKVDKGSPSKARYAIFYAVNKDPVIFCKTRREMIKAVKRLLKRKEVDYKSIRIFKLVGGAKVIKKSKKIKK